MYYFIHHFNQTMNKKFLLLLTGFLLSVSQVFAQSDAARQQIQVDVVYLSSDLLQGREAGKPGGEAAAQYIASRFAAIGLKPKGNNGSWFHSFTFHYNGNPHEANAGEVRTAQNVVGYLDNGAKTTVIIGAHYDHLGYGIPGSSRYVGDPAIHNGADDNASGVASLLYLANYLKKSNLKKNNYLFIAFSAEELGLIGSKKFVEAPSLGLTNINYMLNMDMVGRLNAEKVVAINGAGTSPVWKDVLPTISVAGIKTKTSDSGMGPSDHASFYQANIPVLHFFTGQHADYHKPSDDSELINYQGLEEVSQFIAKLIETLNTKGRLTFTKTKDEAQQGARFKVSMGVMPDYVYDGEGLRVDAVLDDRPAQKAGLAKGDVIVQMGETTIKTVYDYMGALANYNKGDKVKIKLKRNGEVLEKEIEF